MNAEHALAVEEIELVTRDYCNAPQLAPPCALTFLDFCALHTAHEATQLLGKHISAERFQVTLSDTVRFWESHGHGDRVKMLGLRTRAQGFQIPPHLDEAVRNGTLK